MSNDEKRSTSQNSEGADQQKVISLPTRMNQHHAAQQRLKGQRFAAAVSLGSVIMISLFLNQFLTYQKSGNEAGDTDGAGNRFIASLPENQKPENLKWESKMAAELSAKNYPVISAQKPRTSDQFLFGELRGQYAAVLNNDFKISKLQLIGDGQFVISEFESFLISKKGLFSVDYDAVKEAGEDNGKVTYQLLKAGKQVGQAIVEKNAFGNLKTLEFQ